MGILKEIVIWILTLMFGWIIVAFFTGGAIGLGVIWGLMELFPILIKPIIVSGMIFGLIFLFGRRSK